MYRILLLAAMLTLTGCQTFNKVFGPGFGLKQEQVVEHCECVDPSGIKPIETPEAQPEAEQPIKRGQPMAEDAGDPYGPGTAQNTTEAQERGKPAGFSVEAEIKMCKAQPELPFCK